MQIHCYSLATFFQLIQSYWPHPLVANAHTQKIKEHSQYN